MSRSHKTILSVIDPIRTLHVTKLTNEIYSSAHGCDALAIEPVRRDETGQVVRDGVLNLPSRVDFSCNLPTGMTFSDIKTAKHSDFEPVDMKIDDKLELTIFPFAWDEVQISFNTGDDPKRLLRLRLWYLEWFQTRRIMADNALHNVVHSLRGPKKDGELWHVCLDMGSAPADALVELFTVLASRGVSQLTLGAELDRVEH